MNNNDNNNVKPVEYISGDEKTKIYTPRYTSGIHYDAAMQNICDHAPVRIYEKPIRRTTDIATHFNLS